MIELILASASPRRASLLEQLGLSFQIVKPEIDESAEEDEPVKDYINRMSGSKLKNVLDRSLVSPGSVVLCADTVVVLENEILGKPSCPDEGIDMLQRLSDKSHIVMTDVSLGQKGGDSGGKTESSETFRVETFVKFRKLNLDECKDYWKTGEPRDKAGGYGIQGRGAVFVESISGSYSNVVGLPLMETAVALSVFGISVFSPG